jgi:hypothetical protein
VYPARGLLANQGIDPRMLEDNGEIDPQALFALAFDTVTVKTAIAPDMVIDMTKKGSGQVSQIVKDAKPTIILSGRAGRIVIAPAGEATTVANFQSAGIQAGLGIGAALLGLIVIAKALT